MKHETQCFKKGFPRSVEFIIRTNKSLRSGKCRRHWIIVASYAETPLSVFEPTVTVREARESKWLIRKIHI